jgi:hypothetical protein
MLPVANPTAFFAADQDWMFRVRTWNTPQTVLEADAGSAGLQLRVYEPQDADADWTAYVNTLKAVGANVSPEAAFTNAHSVVADGRWPLVQTYWGSGAPNWWGASQTGRVALCFTGVLVSQERRAWLSAGSVFSFALAGSGWARIDVIQGVTRTTLFRGDLTESSYLSDGFRFSNSHTFAEGAELRVYYVQSPSDLWGGLVVKVIPGDAGTLQPTNWGTLAEYDSAGNQHSDETVTTGAGYEYRIRASNSSGTTLSNTASVQVGTPQEVTVTPEDAPVLSCGLFSYGEPVVPVELPFISSINVQQEKGAAGRVDIEVPLLNPQLNDGNGWVYYRTSSDDPGVLQLYENGSLQHTLRRKRLLQVQVARKEASPQWQAIFTGHVDDFGDVSGGKLTIKGVSFEGRMVEQYEQSPDRISYMTRGFRVLDYQQVEPVKRKQPVYNVPAFDNWPLAWAIEELATRAGLDPSCFRKPKHAVRSNGTAAEVVLPWGPGYRFSAVSLSGEPVRLPRAAHYGNVGLSFTETRPFDDPYVFKVEPTKDLWARARELSDKLGYVCGFDATGAAMLYPASSPAFVRDLALADVTAGTCSQVLNPAAYGAKYLSVASGSAATVVATVRASRIDVSFPRVLGARNWTVQVRALGSPDVVASIVVSPTSEDSNPELLFDAQLVAPGANSTVVKVFSGDYREYEITLLTTASAGPALLDCIIAFAQDPDGPLLPVLSTLDAADSVTAKGQQDATRNKVTIVGRRKGLVTDSDKLAEAQAPSEQEFVVQNAVDVRSIVDPTAKNYVGYLKQSVIYDDTISDDGFARYLAQVFIYRQSVPRPSASVSHTMLPMLEMHDPLYIEETKFGTLAATSVQYVRRLSHSIGLNSFKTSIETEPWPEYPAYQPRTDINLADFDYKPVINVDVRYTSLSGHAVQNPSIDAVKPVAGNLVQQTAATLTGQILNVDPALHWPPVPGTVQIRPVYTTSTDRTDVRVESMPFGGVYTAGHRIAEFSLGADWYLYGVRVTIYDPLSVQSLGVVLRVDVPPGSTTRNDYFYYEEQPHSVVVYRGTRAFPVSGTLLVGIAHMDYTMSTVSSPRGWLANNPYHTFVDVDHRNTPTVARVQLPWQSTPGLTMDSGITAFDVRYRSLFPNTARTDPNGVVDGRNYSPFYDPYTSELGHLVSFRCAVLAEGLYRVSVRNWDDGTIVAWLTNPTENPREDEQHWQWLPVSAQQHFTWDGSDVVGLWNAQQSELYSELVEGAFEEGNRPRVGAGHYCWNREVAGGDLGPLAYVWMERHADGRPKIGHGTYARWYIHVEAQTTTEAVPEVTSKEADIAVLTHLPEPTKLELKIHDFNPATQAWVIPEPTISPIVRTAFINNDKPIRVRFKVAPRPGVLWEGKEGEVTVRLTREVHLRAVVADQTAIYHGKEFAGSQVEDRAIYNRRFVNDEHTKQYRDSGYRRAKTFRWDDADPGDAITEWVFKPSDFKKDFRLQGFEESLRFGDYLQLEEVPKWNGARAVSAARSRLHFAMMSYLFYLSAHVTDRSGRSSWGINRAHIDKSKIYENQVPVDWPVDPTYEQRRTITCRQWVGEPGWKQSQLTRFGYPAGSLFDKLLESFWHQFNISNNTIGTVDPVLWADYNLPQDPYSTAHVALTDYKLPSSYQHNTRQLGSISGGVLSCALGKMTNGTTVTGSWNWEPNPAWVPSITRDLHPYFRLPPMVSPPRPPDLIGSDSSPGLERDYRKINCYWTVGGPDIRVSARSGRSFDRHTDITTNDAAAAETWSSPVLDFTGSGPKVRFWPGSRVDIKEAPFKDTIPANALNYARQNEMLTYEELRGVYSRNGYPTAAAVKVPAGSAYYINPYRYEFGLEVGETLNDSPFPLFHTIVERNSPAFGVDWFRIGFRSEYVWESGSMFPTTRVGREWLEGALWWRTRYVSAANGLYYDFGAWTGWKDDLSVFTGPPRVIGGVRTGGGYHALRDPISVGSPFATGHMPVGVGMELWETTELIAHFVLVPERRGS